MEMKHLFGAIVIIVTLSLLVVVGLIMLDTFGDNVKNPTGVRDEAVVVASYTFTTANDEVTAISGFWNLTMQVDAGAAGIARADFNWTEISGVVYLNSSYEDGNYFINYTYDKDSTTTDALDDSRSAIGAISSTWLSLLITVIILSIILGLIIRSFVVKGR